MSSDGRPFFDRLGYAEIRRRPYENHNQDVGIVQLESFADADFLVKAVSKVDVALLLGRDLAARSMQCSARQPMASNIQQ